MIATLPFLLCVCATTAAGETVSAAVLASNPSAFDNQLVKVRACLAASPHGSYLYDCGAKTKPIVLLVPSENDAAFAHAFALSQEHFGSDVRATFTGKFYAHRQIDLFGEQLLADNVLHIDRTSEATVNEP